MTRYERRALSENVKSWKRIAAANSHYVNLCRDLYKVATTSAMKDDLLNRADLYKSMRKDAHEKYLGFLAQYQEQTNLIAARRASRKNNTCNGEMRRNPQVYSCYRLLYPRGGGALPYLYGQCFGS